jgi:hypothetical protein
VIARSAGFYAREEGVTSSAGRVTRSRKIRSISNELGRLDAINTNQPKTLERRFVVAAADTYKCDFITTHQ